MFKFLVLVFLHQPIMAIDSQKDDIVEKIKNKFCDCTTKKFTRELDVELFNEPYLKDSLPIFAGQRFGNLNEVFSFAKVKVILRFKF